MINGYGHNDQVAVYVVKGYRWMVRRIEVALRARFQQDFAERARAAHALHDTLLQTIEASKMIADDALDAPADPVRMRRAIRRLSDWLGQATQEGQALLNSLRATSHAEHDLASQFRRFAEKCLICRAMDFTLSVMGEITEMNPIVHDEIYRIGCEAIGNACKRSGATYLKIALKYELDFRLQVEDDGELLEPTVAERGDAENFDLYEMQYRAQRLGAMLSLIRSSGSENQLILTVPGWIMIQHASSLLPLWLLKLWSRRRPSRSSPD
jgi:signal transduction histidine kinase